MLRIKEAGWRLAGAIERAQVWLGIVGWRLPLLLSWPVRLITRTLGLVGWMAANPNLRGWPSEYRKRAFWQFARALEPVAILIAIIAFAFDWSDRQNEREVRAWQLITTPASGNGGKTKALEYLNNKGRLVFPPDFIMKIIPEWPHDWQWVFSRGIPLPGIDITPKGIVWEDDNHDEPIDRCLPRPFLQGVRLANAILYNARLACVDLRDADLRGAFLRGASLRRANLFGADLRGADLRDADLRDAILFGADLRNVKGLTCAQLTQAKEWESAYRDTTLSCGAYIPAFPDDQITPPV